MAVIILPAPEFLPWLLAIALLGHFGLCVFSHNWWYGQALPRHGTTVVQLLHGLLLVSLPMLFWLCGGYEALTSFDINHASWPTLVMIGYLLLCFWVGLMVLPFITIQKALKPLPIALVRSASTRIDVTKALGKMPLGDGKLCSLARIPGNQVFQVDFVERTLELARLPATWQGLTILHISDLHFCGTPAKPFYEYVLNRCAGLEPDLLALTGDFVDSDEHRHWILPLLSRLRWREAAIAILGNHDQWFEPPRIRRRLERLGIQVLSNRWKEIMIRGEPMVVIGNERPWLKEPLAPIDRPKETFRLCLSHSPDNMPWARAEGMDLMLSGHVHGGQIRVPGIGSIIVPSRFGRRYDCGVFQEGPTVLHVSRGLGGEQPLRFNCAPEVTLLTLQRQDRKEL